ASIEQIGDTVTFTVGQNTAILTANQATMTINNKFLALPQAPYQQNGQLLVPIRELAAALKINMKFSL
ncbi:MAG: dap, partial [Firmicutes bacterium]|nr:dap [Bacillota bacterium]